MVTIRFSGRVRSILHTAFCIFVEASRECMSVVWSFYCCMLLWAPDDDFFVCFGT